MNEEDFIPRENYKECLEAVSKVWQCDFCYETFRHEREAVKHIWNVHVK